MIPPSYPEWRHCIESVCRIPLTPDYIRERLAALADPRDHTTRRFVELYGAGHLQRVRGWFEQALRDGGATP